MALNGLSQINIELSARCNKSCAFCGHQNSVVHPQVASAGDMDFALLERIALQVPRGLIVQFHRDGEPMCYDRLTEALDLFDGSVRSLVTNGKTLGDRAGEIIGHCERVTVSVFEGDDEWEWQRDQLTRFLDRRGNWSAKPAVNVKAVGRLSFERQQVYEQLAVPLITRQLHHPAGDWGYRGAGPPIPEAMICLDLLSHPSIDWRGDLYLCNRLQPEHHGRLGSLLTQTLEELWNGPARAAVVAAHLQMRRQDIAACRGCEYWGLPAV